MYNGSNLNSLPEVHQLFAENCLSSKLDLGLDFDSENFTIMLGTRFWDGFWFGVLHYNAL